MKKFSSLRARPAQGALAARWSKTRRPVADRASARTGTSPTDDTRFGSSNTAEVAADVWQSCIYEMPFVMVEIEP